MDADKIIKEKEINMIRCAGLIRQKCNGMRLMIVVTIKGRKKCPENIYVSY